MEGQRVQQLNDAMQSHRRVGKDLATSLERLEVEASRLEVAEKAAACENATWKWKQLVFFCSCLFLFFVVVVVAAMQVVVVVFFFFFYFGGSFEKETTSEFADLRNLCLFVTN